MFYNVSKHVLVGGIWRGISGGGSKLHTTRDWSRNTNSQRSKKEMIKLYIIHFVIAFWLDTRNILLYLVVIVLITNEPTSWYLLQPLAANIHCGNNREGCSWGSFTSYQPLTFPLIHRHCQHCKEMKHSRLCNYILSYLCKSH